MSIARNNLIREVAPKSLFESMLPVLSSATACTWNQGDILCMDTNVKYLRPVTGSGDSSIVVGVALVSITNGVKPSPYQGTAVDASAAIEDEGGPMFGSVFQMVLATGAAFTPGLPVYLTADPQTVTSVSAGSAVGIYQGRAVASAASGSFGDVLIGANFNPGATHI